MPLLKDLADLIMWLPSCCHLSQTMVSTGVGILEMGFLQEPPVWRKRQRCREGKLAYWGKACNILDMHSF